MPDIGVGRIVNLFTSNKKKKITKFFTFRSIKKSYTVIQKFGFALPKPSGRQLLRKFRVKNFRPKLRRFEPKIRVFEQKLRVFENRSFVILNQSCSFYKEYSFVLPKLRVLIPGFFATETSKYQIHTKFLAKFRLSENRRNSRSFVRK
jgi:hypothetical protein